MPVLSDLEPREVFSWFERLCAIPHGSHHTKAISDYLVAFARERSLACRQDAANNVVIRKAASTGYENAPVVMLQGHIDMVCEKDVDCGKDMETEGLDLFVDGDVIGARGTTLGGDDGIAVAMALAVLDADDIPHGPLECVFTADEEVGMIGARALDASDLKAKYLINIDSEEEGVLTVSCAGACRTLCTLPVRRRASSRSAAPAPAARSARCPSRACPLMEKRSASGSAVLPAGTPARRSTRAVPTPIFCSAARSAK